MTHARPLALAASLASLVAVSLAACGDVSVPDGPRCTSTQSTNLVAISQSSDPDAGEARLAAQCLERAPTLRADGTADCLVIEARKTDGMCACDPAKGRSAVTPAHAGAIDVLETSAETGHTAWDCFCELNQLSPASAEGQLCQNSTAIPLVDDQGHEPQGYCYIDSTTTPPIGNSMLLGHCPISERHELRFAGTPTGAGANSTLAILCESDVCDAPATN